MALNVCKETSEDHF